jgi:antitoxin component of MazEF toxin-antitoxin module
MALVIEKPILELLGAGADTQFEVTTDGKSLTLTPLKKYSIQEANKIANERYGAVFRELAK